MAKILKEHAGPQCHPIIMIYLQTLNMGVVPSAWKEAIVTPLFKKGDERDPGSHRTATLSCHILLTLIYLCVLMIILSYFTQEKLGR